MKKTIIITLVVVSSFTLLFFDFKSFVYSIKNERSCEFANIDNIEIHIGINIPKTESSLCNYDESLNMKSVYFKFKELNSQEYISDNEFIKIKNFKELNEGYIQYFLGDYKSLNKDIDSLYLKIDDWKSNFHFAVYNAKTNEFWAVVYYKD